MDKSNIDIFLENNRLYADGQSTHKQLTLASNPTSHPDARRVACMDARLDVEDLPGLQSGEAHIICNAGVWSPRMRFAA